MVIRSRDVDISCDGDAARKLLVLGGRRPEGRWLADFAQANSFEVWGVDAGVSSCARAGVEVVRVIGDMDSASEDDWRRAVSRGAAEHKYDRAKDRTDFQLALEASGGEPVALTGCFGGRADHLISVIDSLGGAIANGAKVGTSIMIDDAEGIVFVRESGVTFRFKRDVRAISLLAVTDVCDGVCIEGARWPMIDARLERREQWAVSNEACGDSVSIRCASGVLAAYWCMREVSL